MAVTTTKLCNMALLRLGEKETIDDITQSQTTDGGRIMSTIHEQIIEDTLEDLRPPEICGRDQLAPATGQPEFGSWTYAYRLPADFLGMVCACDENNDEIKYEYEIEGDYLLYNHDTCFIKYVRKITDPAKWRPATRTAVILHLAMFAAEPICGKDTQKAWRLEQEYERQRLRCQGLSGQLQYERNGNNDIVNAAEFDVPDQYIGGINP
jgi:hypothetical protein